MRILKVEPGKAPYAKEMEEGLKAIQREVEGLFQPLSMGDGVILCCNDEGKLNGMQPNRRLGDDIICGPFFLVGDDHAGGFCSLTEEQIQRYTMWWKTGRSGITKLPPVRSCWRSGKSCAVMLRRAAAWRQTNSSECFSTGSPSQQKSLMP